MELRKMTPAQWAGVATNPRQRDTNRHAQKAKRTHLKTPSKEHARVDAALLPGGDLVKLDGHTRALLWESRELEPPQVVYVTVYPVKSMQEAKDLYTHFDGKHSLETTRDQISGAFREAGVEPQSGAIKYGPIFSALKNLGKSDPYALVCAWKRELMLIDTLGIPKNRFFAGFYLAALLLLRKHGDSALEFLRAIASNAGTKTAQGSDAVDMFTRHCLKLVGKAGGEKRIVELAGVTLALYDGYRKGKRYTRSPTAFGTKSYLD